MPYFLKILNVALAASIKYFYAPIYAFALGLDFWGAQVGLWIGGMCSFLGFYFATDLIILYVNHLKPVINKVKSKKYYYRKIGEDKPKIPSPKKRFNKRSRILVKFKKRWGLWGIILTSPIIISIPVGAILIRKYYNQNNFAFIALAISILIEGFFINLTYWLIFEHVL